MGHAQRGDLAILNFLFSLFSKKAMKLIFIQQTRIFQLSKLNLFLLFTKLFFALLQFQILTFVLKFCKKRSKDIEIFNFEINHND